MSNKKGHTGKSKQNFIFSEEFTEGPYGSPRGENEPIRSKDANVSYPVHEHGKSISKSKKND